MDEEQKKLFKAARRSGKSLTTMLKIMLKNGSIIYVNQNLPKQNKLRGTTDFLKESLDKQA